MLFVKNAVKTAFLLCSSLIGAGFATGREICEFFPPNGMWGTLSAVFSCALMAVFTYFIIKYGEMISQNIVYRIFVFLFLVCAASAMLAGASVFPGGRIIMTVLVALTYAAGLSGIETAALVLTPIMASYIFVSAFLHGSAAIPPFSGLPSHPFIYAGYNLISFPILLKNIKTEKPFAVSAVLFAVMAPLTAAVCFLTNGFSDFEMPLFSAVGGGVLCGFVLFSAMYTTAACSAFCMADIAGKKYGYFGIFMSFCTSFFGFGKIVSTGYRVFGIIGFAVCMFIGSGSFYKPKRRNTAKYREINRIC